MKASIRRIMSKRADNYAHHFECRQTIKAMSGEQKNQLVHAAGHLTPPRLSLFGASEYSQDQEAVLIALANQVSFTDPWLINPWYTSEAGWDAFQTAWDNLPEPVDFAVRKSAEKEISI